MRPEQINKLHFYGYDTLERLLASLDISIDGTQKYFAIESNLAR